MPNPGDAGELGTAVLAAVGAGDEASLGAAVGAGVSGGGGGGGTTIGAGATIVTAVGLTLVSVTAWAPWPEPLVA